MTARLTRSSQSGAPAHAVGSLADNRITAGGIKLLAEALKSNRSLKTLEYAALPLFGLAANVHVADAPLTLRARCGRRAACQTTTSSRTASKSSPTRWRVATTRSSSYCAAIGECCRRCCSNRDAHGRA